MLTNVYTCLDIAAGSCVAQSHSTIHSLCVLLGQHLLGTPDVWCSYFEKFCTYVILMCRERKDCCVVSAVTLSIRRRKQAVLWVRTGEPKVSPGTFQLSVVWVRNGSVKEGEGESVGVHR